MNRDKHRRGDHDFHDGNRRSRDSKAKLWVPGDWNAFFGFGTNILVNLLVLTGLLRFVLKMPDELVFGRILPAIGLMLCLSTCYYAWLAYNLAKKTGRDDVCALPSGISVPHMFVVTFVVMLPISLATKDPVQAWEAGLTWVFVQSFVLMVGGFIAPVIRRSRRARRCSARWPAYRSRSFRCARRPDFLHAGDRRRLLRRHPGRAGSAACAISAGCRAVSSPSLSGTLIAWGSNFLGLGYGGLTAPRLSGVPGKFRFRGSDPGHRARLLRVQIPRRHSRHRDSVRHLRPHRSARQC